MYVLLSLTTALDRIAAGALTKKDLNEAVYCFGCGPHRPFMPVGDLIAGQAPYQNEAITPDHVKALKDGLILADKERRVVWRRDETGNDRNGSEVHAELNKVFESLGLFPLNPNLPPIIENEFLKTAIAIADKTHSIEVIG